MTATEQDIRQVWLSLRNLAALVAGQAEQLVDSPEYRDARHMLQVTEGMSDGAYLDRIEKLEHDNRSLLRQRDEAYASRRDKDEVLRSVTHRRDDLLLEQRALVERVEKLEVALREIAEDDRVTPLSTVMDYARIYRDFRWIARQALATDGGAEEEG